MKKIIYAVCVCTILAGFLNFVISLPAKKTKKGKNVVTTTPPPETTTENFESELAEQMKKEYEEWYNGFWADGLSPEDIRNSQAERVKKYMDTSMDPCDDFYQYACGNWDDHHPLIGESVERSVADTMDWFTTAALAQTLGEEVSEEDDITKAERKAKYFFASCMDAETKEARGAEPMLDYFKELGGMPLLDSEWSEDDFNWVKLAAEIRTLDMPYIINFVVLANTTNTNAYMTYIGPPKWRTQNDVLNDPVKVAHLKDYYTNFIKLLGADTDDASVKESIDDIFVFMEQIYELTPNRTSVAKTLSNVRQMTIDELSELIPEIDWKVYLSIVQERPIDGSIKIGVAYTEYVQGVVETIKNTKLETVANYLFASLASQLIDELDSKFVDAQLDYIEATYGHRPVQDPLEQQCLRKVNSDLGMAAGAIFVRKFFDEDSRTDMNAVGDLVKSVFREELRSTDWLDEATADEAVEKVDTMGLAIGYPDFILIPEKLNIEYEDFIVAPGRFFENIISAKQQENRKIIALLDEPAEKGKWPAPPQISNAYYILTENFMMLPAGSLIPPMYHKNFPKAFIFGGVGTYLGHEMSHGFDNNGREFDSDGNFRNWWSKSSKIAFNDRVDCFVEQYDSYVFNNNSLVGDISKGENVADNGGIRYAFKAYEKWLAENQDDEASSESLPGIDLSPNQLFFLGMAQMWCTNFNFEKLNYPLHAYNHAPPENRVIGMVSNSEDFASAFNCPIGSPMNPDHKCRVW